jgi:uncharacterized protein YbcI
LDGDTPSRSAAVVDRTFEIQALHVKGGPLKDQSRDPGPAEPRNSVESAICRDILAIHRDAYGGSAGSVRAVVLDDIVIVILDDLELLPNEEYLVEHGRADAVKEVREQFQQAIRATFAAAVERATGRRVVGFASHAELDEPRFAIEIFRLGPRD